MHRRFVLAALAALLLSACADDPSPLLGGGGDPDDAWPGATRCTNSARPQLCPQDYRPVCGRSETGERRTYPNGCEACADNAVVDHRPGACAR